MCCTSKQWYKVWLGWQPSQVIDLVHDLLLSDPWVPVGAPAGSDGRLAVAERFKVVQRAFGRCFAPWLASHIITLGVGSSG